MTTLTALLLAWSEAAVTWWEWTIIGVVVLFFSGTTILRVIEWFERRKR